LAEKGFVRALFGLGPLSLAICFPWPEGTGTLRHSDEAFGLMTEYFISQRNMARLVTVLFGTLGFTPAKFLGALKTLPDVERVVFYTAHTERAKDRDRSEAVIGEVQAALKTFDVPYSHVPLSNPFDFPAILQRFLDDLQAIDPRLAVFNLTGGTKPMAVAATVACMVLGIRAFYVPEEQEGAPAGELPVVRIRYASVLTSAQRRVLEVVRDKEPGSLAALAQLLRVQPPTLSGHLRKLEDLGALRLQAPDQGGQTRRPTLTDAGAMLLVTDRVAERVKSRSLRG
jgi:CRISPR locus-related DNA-binding protein